MRRPCENAQRCDAAQVMYDLLKACFGTIMVEPDKWEIVSTAAPGRKYFRDLIKVGGKDRPAFTDESVQMLDVLIRAALRTGDDWSTYPPERVRDGITEFLDSMGWGDYKHLSLPSIDRRRDARRREAVAALACAALAQLVGKTRISEADEERIRASLKVQAQILEENLWRADRLDEQTEAIKEQECLEASIGILMQQIGFPEEAGFLTPSQEQGAWKALSNIYCGGTKVDSLIDAGLASEAFDRYGAQATAAMRYFSSKFSLKRGNVTRSNVDLAKLGASLEHDRARIDGTCLERLTALAEVRKLTNNAEPTTAHAEKLARALDSLQGLEYASDEYKAYETASAIGAEVTNALARGPIYDPSTASCFKGLVAEHARLMDEYPAQLGNQGVVAVSLRWFMELSVLAGKPNAERNPHALLSIAVDGLETAREKKNSLFHIQCVIVLAICAACVGDEGLFTALGIVARKLMTAFGVNSSQEGIWQLFSALEAMYPDSTKKLLNSPDDQLRRLETIRPSLLPWANKLDVMYQKEMSPAKRAYKVPIEQELMKLERFSR